MVFSLRHCTVGLDRTFAAGLQRGTRWNNCCGTAACDSIVDLPTGLQRRARWYFGSGTAGLDAMVHLLRYSSAGRHGT